MLNSSKGQHIALTGGIASGKSFILNCFKNLGFEIWQADLTVSELITNEGICRNEIVKNFPEVANRFNGIDKEKLSHLFFNNPEKSIVLENILWKHVRLNRQYFIKKITCTIGKSIVFEVPLLFENSQQQDYDFVISAVYSLSVQKKRAMRRNNMTINKFNAIIKKQTSNKIRRNLSNFIINTNTTKSDTMKQIKALLK